MPTSVNGRLLGVQENGVFTAANTDSIPGGKLWPEAAAAWNAMRAAAIADGVPASDFMPAGPNSSGRGRPFQDYVWDQYLHHGGAPAARPYSSNHGWAIAVDVKTRRAAAWILVHGSKFGWSHDEGARVGEWWHFRYIGGFKPKKADPLKVLTPAERHLVTELDALRKGHKNPARRRELVAALTLQRKRIFVAARKSGWGPNDRRQRYRILLDRTRPR